MGRTASSNDGMVTISLVMGILGVTAYATVSSIIASLLIRQIELLQIEDLLWRSCLTISALSVFYVSLMLSIQFFASLQFPLTLRLAMVFAVNLVCWQNAQNERLDGVFVIAITPFCLGGFIQHWRGWRALGWAQTQRTSDKISIATLLDLTASVALVMGLLQTGPVDLRSVPVLLPAWILMGIVGMHLWFRLTRLCRNSRDRENGFVFWLVGSAMSGVLLILALIASDTRMGIIATFVMIPGLYVLVHFWTAIPLWWLRACGWTFASPDEDEASSSASTENAWMIQH